MNAEKEVNPYASPNDTADGESMYIRQKPSWLRRTSLAQLIVLCVGCAAAFLAIETIIASGPIYACVGIAVAIFGRYALHPGAVLVGISAPVLLCLVGMLITVNRWSPDDARIPVRLILAVYAVGALPFLLHFLLAGDKQSL